MKSINKQKISEVLNSWSEKYLVMAPVSIDGNTVFKKWQEGSSVELEKNSDIPPKSVFFPQTEELYDYKIDKENVEIMEAQQQQEKFIVFGIKPCDLKSLEMLDDVFLTKGFVDPYYKTKRDNAILIANLCSKPQRTCFCNSMGIDYQKAPGADLVMYPDGDNIGFAAQTPIGEEALKNIENLLEEKDIKLPEPEKLRLSADTEGLAEKLAGMFEHPYWDSIYEKCLGCGACTYVCPTCHCFDINSHNRSNTGFKTRCWDSCMFSDYTLMAGGHNPRPSRKERFRNRFLHKLQYFPERYGKTACVGCGRCIVKCPVNVDITRIIAQLKEVDVNDGQSIDRVC
jgi:sulfhydrogenase subunit beta (sulfur reductase)